ncbi:MAG UNVERIFIED_CONTAM: 5'/3'-nucleotidase SurE [Anaerolineae bacterium]
MNNQRPLVLFTNDDGIASPGLWSVARAFEPTAEIWICAPMRQQSGTGRSLTGSSTGRLSRRRGRACLRSQWTARAAQSVQHGVMEVATRMPDLVVVGSTIGENCGNGVTISGTVGAALEAACFGIKAIAVSQQTDHNLHHSYSREVDFNAGAYFTKIFADWFLQNELPFDVDFLKIDLPTNATLATPWRIARLSKKRVYYPTVPDRQTSYAPNRLATP